jgi:hypothetical protein
MLESLVIVSKPMSFLLQPLNIFFAVLVEHVRKQQEMVIEYLQLENQVLREKLAGKRVLLNDDQRRLLAVKGKALGRNQLNKIATIAQADTILRWHRELIEHVSETEPSRNAGRPPVDQEVADLVLRMARENESWGYKRIEGQLRNVGYVICSSTVANILKRNGIEPPPSRKRTTSWSTFFKAHWDAFESIDLATITLWFGEQARGIFDCGAKNEQAHCATAATTDDKTPSDEALRTATFAICISSNRSPEAHLARPPPPVRRGSNSSRDIPRVA